ncbi:glycosyltransferase [Clostridium saccharobutylicum]|uniref:Glycosyl transferase family 28 C-terminal domain-containing protein n=1 Tax=Clostridium saccharobutylicum TaxID=169679 RepID=A0A1S8NJ82_CLOSA|nr:glycosyltransferase [Clostridium saccharobutylicum]OOM16549.1 hypothetical protein CLOSAC_08200 [Clostridium saccharobutylicum]
MIFVTVGTHEQGMDRLFIELDRLIETGKFKGEIFAQIGYSNYIPKNYKYKKMIGYDEMDEYVKKSNIVITHGGPGSIFHPLQYGKIPIVVPRNPEFNEHVDNHQILFTKRLESNNKVIGIYDIKILSSAINNYDNLAKNCNIDCSDKEAFIGRFELAIDKIL